MTLKRSHAKAAGSFDIAVCSRVYISSRHRAKCWRLRWCQTMRLWSVREVTSTKSIVLSCHGAKLEGQPNWQTRLPNDRLPAPPHDKTGHTWHHNDALLFKITKLGTKALAGDDYETDMRGFSGELSDKEIIAVLSYIKSTWPAEIRQRHDQMNKR